MTFPTPGPAVERQWLAQQIAAALPNGHGLSPLPGLNTDPAGKGPTVKVYFAARCECTTAAVLSVEVAREKSRADVTAAVPALVARLVLQRDAFRRMPCASHTSLRTVFGQPAKERA